MIEFFRRRWGRLRQRRPDPVPPLAPVTFTESDPLVREIAATRPTVERVLTENILPFWFPGPLDEERGGYHMRWTESEGWVTGGTKFPDFQARVCWFLSRAARAGYLAEGIAAARHGFEFLRDRAWDPEFGGFFFEVDAEGGPAPDPRKMIYAESLCLYAVSEYAVASGDAEAARLATASAAVLEERYRDPVLGGYRREFTRTWEPRDPSEERAGHTALKSYDEHLHVLEALAAYRRVPGAVVPERRLLELLTILTSTVVRYDLAVPTDWHRPDWTPLTGGGYGSVSYGHDLECFWLASESWNDLGLPMPILLNWGRALLDHTLRWGCDPKGGVYFRGPPGGPAYDRQKVWWAQAESLVGALVAYRATGDERYGRLYLSTLDWILRRHVDWEGGEWHGILEPDGRISDEKVGRWKAPYHNGRAMMLCLDLLRAEGG